MPLVIIKCEHCGEEANLFLRQSELGKPALCPNCGKAMRGKAENVTESTPLPTDKGPS